MSPPLLRRLSDHSPAGPLPQALEELYDGWLWLPSPCCYGNFVTSVDGVVAVEERRDSGSLISGRNRADRFLMGLLRAFADLVLVGAGTVRAEGRGALWTPDYVYPDAASGFSELRASLGLPPQPRLAVLTASGELDPTRPALLSGPIILAPSRAVASLPGDLASSSEVLTSGEERVDLPYALAALRERGYRRILCEGGPTTFGEMLRHRLVDQLFLTVSPVLAGRKQGGDRLGLVEGAHFASGRFPSMELLSVRRSGSHLFLRYGLEGATAR
jgi:riboflavin biosynthesis pyrimidine reductase